MTISTYQLQHIRTGLRLSRTLFVGSMVRSGSALMHLHFSVVSFDTIPKILKARWLTREFFSRLSTRSNQDIITTDSLHSLPPARYQSHDRFALNQLYLQ